MTTSNVHPIIQNIFDTNIIPKHEPNSIEELAQMLDRSNKAFYAYSKAVGVVETLAEDLHKENEKLMAGLRDIVKEIESS